MTTRIVLALLAFTAAVLVGAVVPLTLNATGHDRTSFLQATEAQARTDADLAQAKLVSLAEQRAGQLTPSAAGVQAVANWPLELITLQNMQQTTDSLLIVTNTGQTVDTVRVAPGEQALLQIGHTHCHALGQPHQINALWHASFEPGSGQKRAAV